MRHNFDRYCKNIENVENYEKAKADNFRGWEVHHIREAEFSRKELITLGMYYNVSSEELIFLTRAEHNKLHKKGNTYMLGKHLSEETKKKLSDAKKGKYTGENNPMYGKQGYWKGKTGPNKGKLAGENNPMYGKHHSAESIQKISEAMKGKRLSEETKNKMSLQRTGRHWYNNGKENKFCYECPECFTPGRLH